MFSNVGGEIKSWAKFMIVAITILFAIWGFCSMPDAEVVIRLALGIVYAVFGFVFGRLSAITLYAFGDLVENVRDIKEGLDDPWVCGDCGKENRANKMTCVGCGRPKTVVDASAPWTCSYCGKENAPDARYCVECGLAGKM